MPLQKLDKVEWAERAEQADRFVIPRPGAWGVRLLGDQGTRASAIMDERN
jgi:hypothetical protein